MVLKISGRLGVLVSKWLRDHALKSPSNAVVNVCLAPLGEYYVQLMDSCRGN